MTAQRTVIQTEHAPAAIGPYSQAIRAGGLVFCSGQIGLDPATGKLISDDVVDQARQAMDNLVAVLKAAGAEVAQLAKTTIFLADMADFARVNEVYASYFRADPPARAAVQAAGLPLGCRVEVEGVAVLDAE